MKLNFELAGTDYHFDSQCFYQLGIPLNFDGDQVNHFGAKKAKASPMQSGGFIGDVKQGGSCNAFELHINPHCHGTHTESISHIVDELIPPYRCIDNNLIPCALVSVSPVLGANCQDSYQPTLTADDKVITSESLIKACKSLKSGFLEALIIRTLPNDSTKTTAHYNEQHQPPFLSQEAMIWIREQGVQHLLVDFPSVDRLNDDGLLSNHRNFWQVEPGTHRLGKQSRTKSTISELVYCETNIPDGGYLLNLNVPALCNDAVPSAPILYPLESSL